MMCSRSSASFVAGPFKSEQGDFYIFGRDQRVATKLVAYRLKNEHFDTQTWTFVATTGRFAKGIKNITATQRDNNIRLTVCHGLVKEAVYKFQNFNMSTNKFGRRETIVKNINSKVGGKRMYGGSIIESMSGKMFFAYPSKPIRTIRQTFGYRLRNLLEMG